jgi:dihydroneopterin aldolase
VDKILVHGIQFFGYHGVRPEEHVVGGRYVVDVTIEADLRPAAASDDVADTVNYSEVYRTVVEIGQGRQFKLIETLAETIAQAILERFAQVEAVEVRVKKQPPPTAGILEYAGVEIVRRRCILQSA